MIDPKLSINEDSIPPVGDQPIKFLGMTVQVPRDAAGARSALKESLERMLTAVDKAAVSRNQKLRLFKQGICPRLSWHFLVADIPITWFEKEAQPLATRYLKKWAGLARSANTVILFLPAKKGGLGLPSITNLYRKQHLSKQTQLLTSHDTSVRHIAEQHLQRETQMQRQKFRPAVMVDQVRSEKPDRSRQALTTAVKAAAAEKEEHELLEHLHSLPQQGEMSRQFEGNSAGL